MKFSGTRRDGGKKHWETYYHAIQKQQWRKALSALDELRKGAQENPQIHLKTGDLLRRMGDAPDAVKAYHRAAGSLFEAGFSHKAIAVYKIILRLDPRDREADERSRRILAELDSPPAPPLQSQKQAPMEAIAPAQAEPAQGEPTGQPPVWSPLPGDEAEETASVPQEEGPLQSPFDEYGTPLPEGGAAVAVDKPQEDILAGVFPFLVRAEREELKERATHRSYKDRETVINEGETGDSLYVIKNGRARVVSDIMGKDVELAVLSAGDFFGEVAFLTGRPRTASVIAEGELEAMELNSSLLKEAIEKNPLILDSMVDFYHSRVQDTLMTMKDKGGK